MFVDVNWKPQNRELRHFGLGLLVFLPLVGWVWGGGFTVIGVLAGIGAAACLLGFTRPQVLKPVFVVMNVVAMPFSLVIGEIVLVLIFVTMFVPLAVLFRLIGRDALQLKLDRNSTSYWQPKKQPKGPASYYRQS